MSSSNLSTTLAENQTLQRFPEQMLHFDLEDLQIFHTSVGIASIFVCLIGLVGNILTLIILSHKDMRSTTYIFLTALACSDILVLISGTLLICLVSIEEIGPDTILVDDQFLPYFYRLIYPLAMTCINTSVYVTIALSADRYIAVCHGMNRTNLCSQACAKRICVLIFVLCFAYNIPTYFEFEIQYKDTGGNATTAYFVVSEFGQTKAFCYVYRSWLAVPLMWGIPFLSLTYMNIRLIHAVRQSRITAKKLRQPIMSRGNDVTIMLIAIIVAFLVFQSPFQINTLMWVLTDDTQEHLFFTKFTFFSTLLVIVNSSINFFLYTLFGRKFRRTFLQKFCGCFIHQPHIRSGLTEESLDAPIMQEERRTTETSLTPRRNGPSIYHTATPLDTEQALIPMDDTRCSSLDVSRALTPLPSPTPAITKPERRIFKRLHWPNISKFREKKKFSMLNEKGESVALETINTQL